MKKTFVFAGLALALAASAHAKLPKAITFDGSCDGYSEISVKDGVATAVYDLTGCGSGLAEKAFGVSGKGLAAMGSKGISLSDLDPSSGSFYHYVLNENGTWSAWASDGTALGGTWTAAGGLTKDAKKSSLKPSRGNR